MNLLTQNSKLKKTSKHFGVNVWNFNIPAHTDPDTGKRTCPFAGECANWCYASWQNKRHGYSYPNAKKSAVAKYNATKSEHFVDMMVGDILRRKCDYVRVHDAGDYYSPQYRDKWFSIARRLPNVKFYSYTKSLPFFRDVDIPPNFDIIFSYGGKLDDSIDTSTERHSKVFPTADDLSIAGYVDTSDYDLFATKWFSPSNHKVGLIKH
jgi:hypothetical protein